MSKPIGYATVTLSDRDMGGIDICCVQPKKKDLQVTGCVCSLRRSEYIKVALMPLPKKKSRKK